MSELTQSFNALNPLDRRIFYKDVKNILMRMADTFLSPDQAEDIHSDALQCLGQSDYYEVNLTIKRRISLIRERDITKWDNIYKKVR